MRKDAYPKQKVELVFETSRLKQNGEPFVVTAHDVPQEYAEAIPRYFDMMNDGDITIDETAYNSKLRGMRRNNPDTKDYLGWMHHKLGPNLGKAGIWGCKLIGQYSIVDKNPQRALFYDGQPETSVTQPETERPEIDGPFESLVEIKEMWGTKNGNFRPGAKLILVAIHRETGEFIASREMPEDFSGEVRNSLEQEAETILARQKAA
ncbi:hypothetical protein A3F64_02655 [Candidatus Saccharibacteria bacterium RIFCSPHIGHO2_12_FULL_42_8]|nr:MAG: hypothetical protein A3F64_02655 [Candidatus Saccharibacteria bacterium RIFCSPHIGHO2_12_FULL_42_8]